MTKLGLSITGPVHSLRTRDKFAGNGDHLIYLRCFDQEAPNHHLAIMVRDLGDNNFSRKNRTLCRLPTLVWEGTENKMIYIRKKSEAPSLRKILQIGKSLVFRIDTSALGGSLQIAECWPPGQWISDTNRLIAPVWQDTAVSVNNWSWHAVLLLQVNTPTVAKLRNRKGFSLACMLVLGYDGIHDRCWSHLKPVTSDMQELWEQSVDTSIQGATYKLPSSKFNWTMKVDLADSPEQESIGKKDDESVNVLSQSSYIIPVKIDISMLRSRTRKGAAIETFSASNLRRSLLKLTGKQSFASLVSHSSDDYHNKQSFASLVSRATDDNKNTAEAEIPASTG